MSLELQFFSLSLSELTKVIGSHDRRMLRAILLIEEADLAEVHQPEDFEDGPDFEEALEEWLNGEVEAEVEQDRKIVNTVGHSLAFAAILRHIGKRIGTLNHSSGGGDLFREKFLSKVTKPLLGPPFDPEFLLSRPLLGWESIDFPFWGYMSQTELATLAAPLARKAPGHPSNDDIDRWLVELWSHLSSALELGKDLVTIYG